MCIMTVKAGAHYTTVTQALAHNLDTVCGDLAMIQQYLMAHPHLEGIDREAHSIALNDILTTLRISQHDALLLWHDAMCQDCGDDSAHMGVEAVQAISTASRDIEEDHMHQYYEPSNAAQGAANWGAQYERARDLREAARKFEELANQGTDRQHNRFRAMILRDAADGIDPHND